MHKHIAMISDISYLIQTCVTLYSLKNSIDDEIKITVHVISNEEIPNEDKKRINTLSNDNFVIDWIVFGNKINLPLPDEKYVAASQAALIKFNLCDIFNYLDDILYLDGDLIIKTGICDIFKYDLHGVYAAVVPDLPQVLYDKPIFNEGNGIKYFNSGVMLLNLKAMREDNIRNILYEDRRSHPNDLLMDQNSLNRVFGKKTVIMDPKFNVTVANLIRSRNKYNFVNLNKACGVNYKNLEELIDSASVIHYSSKDKPWLYFDAPKSDLWIYNFCLSPYAEVGLDRCSLLKKRENKKIKTTEVDSDTIAIVYCTNKKYVPAVMVSVKSIEKNAKNPNKYKIYVFSREIDEEIEAKLKLVSKVIEINVVNISKLIGDGEERLKICGHFTIDMYFRWFIPEVLYQFDRVIYLDCDVVVNKDLTDLYGADLSGKTIGACLNLQDKKKAEDRFIKYKIDSDHYVNSGVLVIDVKRFIKNNYKEKLFNFVYANGKIDCPDQDALNVVCKSDIKILNQKWNVQWHHYFLSKGKSLCFDWNSYIDWLGDPYIIHYSSNVKPWVDGSKYRANLFLDIAKELDLKFDEETKDISKQNNEVIIKDFVNVLSSLLSASEYFTKNKFKNDIYFKELGYKQKVFIYCLKQKDVNTASIVFGDILKQDADNVVIEYENKLEKLKNSISMKISRPYFWFKGMDVSIDSALKNDKRYVGGKEIVISSIYLLIKEIANIIKNGGVFNKPTVSSYPNFYKINPIIKQFIFSLRNNDVETACMLIMNDLYRDNVVKREKLDSYIKSLYATFPMRCCRPLRWLIKKLQ